MGYGSAGCFRFKVIDLALRGPLKTSLIYLSGEPEARSAATAQRKRPAQLYRRKSRTLIEFDRTV
jgi:hypothetical protein